MPHPSRVAWIVLAAPFAISMPAPAGQKPTPAKTAPAPAPKKEIKAAGILFDRDRKANWMTVKADGDDAPVKYRIDPSNKRLARELQSVFNASRVRLIYREEDGSRSLVAIERQILKEEGTVTGVVVKVHNDFWVELKPRNGVADAFAPGANYNDKAFIARLKALQPGDSVTIRYNTDFERHRILAMRKNPPPAPPKADPKAKLRGTPAPGKE